MYIMWFNSKNNVCFRSFEKKYRNRPSLPCRPNPKLVMVCKNTQRRILTTHLLMHIHCLTNVNRLTYTIYPAICKVNIWYKRFSDNIGSGGLGWVVVKWNVQRIFLSMHKLYLPFFRYTITIQILNGYCLVEKQVLNMNI